MLKGVNRKIIEVRDPDSRYFERAILFVRQGDWAPKEIDEQAEQCLRAASEEMGRTRTASPSATLLKERVGLRKLLFRAGAAAGLLLLAAALVGCWAALALSPNGKETIQKMVVQQKNPIRHPYVFRTSFNFFAVVLVLFATTVLWYPLLLGN